MTGRLRILVAGFSILLGASLGSATELDTGTVDIEAIVERARSLTQNKQATADERTAIVTELAKHPTSETSALIVSVGLAAADPAPRTAARAALVTMGTEPGIRKQILTAYKRESKRPGPLAAELALVLLAGEQDARAGGFRQQFDRQPLAAAYHTAVAVMAAAAAPGDASAIAALRNLAASRCFGASLAYRRGLIKTLAELRNSTAVEVLVDMLQGLSGEARGDVIAYLTRISGERHGTDARAWRTWFDTHRATLVLDGGQAARSGLSDAPPVPDKDDTQADYYDIPIYADRVIFVLDTSSSMQGDPLQAAKRELESAIFALPDATQFAVIYFNSGVGPWQRQFVPATEPNKRAAAAFVNQLPPEGGTATSDALEAAFTFDAEAIFFLSDGAPSAGKIVDPRAIVDYVTRLNAGRYVSVNTISIMGGAAFLEDLAKANNGSFRAVNR